jgi:hypothetical protein
MDVATRNAVRVRAGNRCEYCRLPDSADEWPFHVEHIVAKQHGGDENLLNLCWAYSRCNLYKGTNLVSIGPQTGAHANLYHPRQQRCSDYFAVSGEYINGRNETGRATVRLLHINDDPRLELRRELIAAGHFFD